MKNITSMSACPCPCICNPPRGEKRRRTKRRSKSGTDWRKTFITYKCKLLTYREPLYPLHIKPRLNCGRDRGFTFVPDSIIETIKCLVYIPAPDDFTALEVTRVKAGSRPFARSQTAPADTAGYSRALGERTRSVNVTSMHGMKAGIHLILSNNMITKLPRSIWELERLTVLSLRE
jgi:hypothetical protein